MQFLSKKLVTFTENTLTHIKRKNYIKREKQKRLHPFLDWLGAFLWAACAVFIINQFLFQAYVIPSKSMEKSLLVGDRILVNKFIYGPELLPGFFKIQGFKTPIKEDVVVFENPEYRNRGTTFDIVSRLIFMLTLSMVDIDKDLNGKPAHHFLIKRVIATNGDVVKIEDGDVFIKPRGLENFFKENSHNYEPIRSFNNSFYSETEKEIRQMVYSSQISNSSKYTQDLLYSRKINYKYLSHISPSMVNYYQEYNIKDIGFYVPEGWLLPLGDNRDNSKDGRYFGIIRDSEVLGKASLRFWPFSRFGSIK
ncbi:signal peptidase I [Thiospirochaeta perfilievii]|uniref:Signal peptidase I n=1 Tax=Thiospirochaeta perfilievii TaxID=252967 RepID=A0A5C1QFB1_9SPIO|nr:signal peptidase I [Thiospirochaeta perfilievii]QEN06098.1 signal peptidase I [Thiospirochaeta perfilievii]